ncbi:PREDICTED: uncharacterized protein LOC104597285 [Nelumbo nucifera]|uniref:Uncharacterized protein LOC104597285 n=1 Tax=Nelumbo nucifera TaxID=4432 RepID=A0A1U8A6M9_NELNU|nr:PREDICTED: uncharacterized protein LOC104597285 [Nelumbo nucifera]
MPDSVAERISLFRSQLEKRRFDDESLRILEMVLVSKDVKSLLSVRWSLRELMRSEILHVIKEMSDKTIEQKLSVIDFFVRAFALAGDIKSCLTWRYEALVLREHKSTNHPWLQVSYEEWLNFAEISLDNGFYSIAVKGCEYALLSVQSNDIEDTQMVLKIKKLKNVAMSLIASQSVRAQTAEYLQKKRTQQDKSYSLQSTNTQCLASFLFRNGIKKRNMRKLHEFQNMQQRASES